MEKAIKRILKDNEHIATCNCPYTNEVIKAVFVGQVEKLDELKPIAFLYPISKINTDPQRFQNRNDAFSELSAEAVAKNFNPNKFDPVVVWFDGLKDKVFVLSGHSRLEGMKRRNEKFLPVRFFEGNELEAIQFARLDANRAATKESLIEDLKAYNLAKFGDITKGIAPGTKEYLKEIFRGKEKRLEPLSYLNQTGKFIEILANEEIQTQFPNILRLATWTGILRKKFGQALTNTHEKDIFNFLYGNDKNNKISRDKFEDLISERLSYGKERLFPECKEGEPCGELKDFKELPPNGHLYKELNEVSKDLEILKNRISRNTRQAYLIYTEEEKKAVRELISKLEEKTKKLKRDIGIVEKEQESGLFGLDDELSFIIYYKLKGKNYKYFSNETKQAQAKKNLVEFLIQQGFKRYDIYIKKIIKV